MADFPRQSDLFRVARDEVLARNGKLTKASVERDGSDANVLVNAGVAAADEIMGQLVTVAAGIYLDSATLTALDRYAFDRYGLVRKPASVAQGSVVFSLVVPAAGAFTIPDGTLLQTVDGLQFITVGDQLFLQSSSSLTVPVRSVLAGANQQAAVNTISSIISAIPGAPDGLTVNNIVATAGADDDEDDASLRDRCRRFFTTARRGTLDAVVSGALASPGVTKASAFEVVDSVGRPSRYVLLVVTDKYTDTLAQLSTIPASYNTQSQQLTASVFSNLDEYRAAGVFVQVMVAQVILQAIQLNLTFAAGFDAGVVAQQVRAAVVAFINGLAPGDTLVVNSAPLASLNFVKGGGGDLQSAVAAIPGLVLTGNEILTPAGAVAPKPLQVLRTTMQLVSAIAATGQSLIVGSSPDLYVRSAL